MFEKKFMKEMEIIVIFFIYYVVINKYGFVGKD